MKKVIIFSLIVLIILVLGGIIIMALLNPLRKSEESIREDILELTPIGSTMEEVIEVIENNRRWKYMWINHENNSSYTDLTFDRIIGTKSIKVIAGSYRNMFETFVEIYWGFDEDEKLIEVGIRKTTVSL